MSSRVGAEPQPSLRRIGSEAEPPNSAAEKNRGCGVFQARNPQSPVRNHQGSTAKTPRNRGNFSGCSRMRAGSLCNSRLGGGASRIRTCSIALLSPALHWGESTAKPDRPTWQQRQTRDAVSFRAGTRSLRFGYTSARRPKPRGIAGMSRAVPGCGREVSATADWVAERVGVELSVLVC